MSFDKMRDNRRSFRTHIRRAMIRPDPYNLPGWVIDSHQLADTLLDLFRDDFRQMIEASHQHGREIGSFICYDFEGDTLKLGKVCMGHEQEVIVRDCIGYRPIGSFHVHLGPTKKLAFSPPDIRNGLNEFVLAVGGIRTPTLQEVGAEFKEALKPEPPTLYLERFRMAVLSPYNYWKLPNEEKDAVDYNLRMASHLLAKAKLSYNLRIPDWEEIVIGLEKEANWNMEEVFNALKMVHVQL